MRHGCRKPSAAIPEIKIVGVSATYKVRTPPAASAARIAARLRVAGTCRSFSPPHDRRAATVRTRPGRRWRGLLDGGCHERLTRAGLEGSAPEREVVSPASICQKPKEADPDETSRQHVQEEPRDLSRFNHTRRRAMPSSAAHLTEEHRLARSLAPSAGLHSDSARGGAPSP